MGARFVEIDPLRAATRAAPTHPPKMNVHTSPTTPPRAAIADDGTVEGYASLFGAIDQA